MGPVALFDKSFLESLNPDESVWFDHFFLANVCPIFYSETQSDLAKTGSHRGTPEKLVGTLANKFPEFSGAPNMHHLTICQANLLGETVSFSGRVIVPAGCQAEIGGHFMEILPESDEAKAFLRWTQGVFAKEERAAAEKWRSDSSGYTTEDVLAYFQEEGCLSDRKCGSLADVLDWANDLVDKLTAEQQLVMGCGLLGIKHEQHGEAVAELFKEQGRPTLKAFAPYVDFCFRVEVFYHLAVSKSRLRKSHRMDICYLFYLPFCQIFTSNDWVHKEVVPLFLRSNQQFVNGAELKAGLGIVDEVFKTLPEAEKRKSIHQIAPHPPLYVENLVTRLWDVHWPNWKAKHSSARARTVSRDLVSQWKEKLKELELVGKARAGESNRCSPSQLDAVVRKRVTRKRKGSWWLVPEELRVSQEVKEGQRIDYRSGVTRDAVLGNEVCVYVLREGTDICGMPGCRTYLENDKLHIDCAPSLNRRYAELIPDGAIVSQSKDGEFAVFLSGESPLGLLIQKLWEKEEKRGYGGEI